MATQNVFAQAISYLKKMFEGVLRSFRPDQDDYPETGTTPLKHDIYKEGKKKSRFRY